LYRRHHPTAFSAIGRFTNEDRGVVLPAKNRKAMSKNSIAILISEAEGFGAGAPPKVR